MINVKQNDTRPAASTSLTRGTTIVDLTLATSVTFRMRMQNKVDISVEGAAVILDAVLGSVEYRWATGETDTVGMYDAEWEVLWNDSTVETFPTIGQDLVRIGGNLDGT
jgi:hypothetical protein